ncbi:hypothetical protein HPP92_028602 [Vanilla planifolia]|uniref:Uncharacterized protein n=1 Tax=Vanilla planifolia TaxID=51239 RepID=A0A835P7F1_VANPL|nr:hypothetical protein HPP92_028602 [Vanilla planifolia]
MAEGKVDLARISQPKPASEAFGGKGVSVGLLDEEKVLVGLDDSKDQLNSENSIPCLLSGYILKILKVRLEIMLHQGIVACKIPYLKELLQILCRKTLGD